MNIVILTALFPYPLTSGGAQAQYNMIDKLRYNHKITIIFPERKANSLSAMKELQSKWPEVTFYPYKYWRQLLDPCFFVSKIKRAFNLKFRANDDRFKVERLLKPYGMPTDARFKNFINNVILKESADIVQIEFFQLLHHVNMLPVNVKKIFIHHELRYMRNMRLLSGIDLQPNEFKMYNAVKQNEISDLNLYDKVVTLTSVDKDELIKSGVKVPIYVSPAAVNTPVLRYSCWNGNIIFLGGHGHIPNQEGINWFFKFVVPQVDWNKYPNVRIGVVGKGWDESRFHNLPNNVKVDFYGFVEDLSSVMSGAIMIVPILSGSGMRMKILEASALGVPFVTTTVGVEGLDFVDKSSCLIADTSESWAQALENLMSSDKLRSDLAESALKVYNEKYSVEALSKVRESVYYG